ncbi:MAG TPA: hypothetical protein VGR20_10835 [Acidimicrobiia bacterium]|nr:hypothetical protein [Acidimicrobiia bacterium]
MTLPDNFICRPYRGVSVQHWTGPLDEGAVTEVILSREAYRRTEFIVLRGADGATAMVQITCTSQDELFNPVKAVEWLGGPDDCTYVIRHDVDSANATALAEVALSESATPICVVEGRYQHVNFIVRAKPLVVRLVDVVPPEPPRLLDLARQAIAIDEDLPPVELCPELLDVRALAANAPDDHYLLPCQGAGLDLPGTIDYLDQRPARADWTLVGCERSRQFHRWFYGTDPDRQVELCPDRLIPADGSVTLLRCCLIERGIRVEGRRAVVPWGTNLAEVQAALHALTGDRDPGK